MFNPALSKFFLPWILGAILVFFVFYAANAIVGNDSTNQLLFLSICIAIVLALLVGFNALKKRL